MRGNPRAAFDVAGAGNAAWSEWCDTRRRKGEPTGNTNIDLNRRVSPLDPTVIRAFFPSVPTVCKEVALSLPILSGVLGSGCVSSHSARAVIVGSTPAFFHHAASSP